jgi:hypothetical protein
VSNIQKYFGALLRQWIALVSGVGSVILGAISASLKESLPYWSFWTLALICFFIASFRAWRDVHAELQVVRSELDRLRVAKYSAERLRLAREEYAKLGKDFKSLLRELRLRGQMMEGQAAAFYESHGFGRMYGLLNALQNSTSFVRHDIGDQFRINPDMEGALDKIWEEESGKPINPSS